MTVSKNVKGGFFMKMRKALSFVLTAAMISSVFTFPAAASFADTNGHWAEQRIEKWSNYGVMNGADNQFRPDDALSRGELAAVLAKLFDLQEMPAYNPFSDLEDDAWYTEAMLKCYAAGIFGGDAEGTIRPTESISRQEFAVVMMNAANLKEKTGVLSSYQDADEVADWAKTAMETMVTNQFMNGVGERRMEPQADVTRASFVAVLDNMISGYATEENGTVAANGGIVLVAADGVTVTGSAENVFILPSAGDTVLEDTQADNVYVQSEGAQVSLQGETSAQNVYSSAEKTTIAVGTAATVDNVVSNQPNTSVAVEGTVGNVTFEQNAAGSSLEVSEDATVEKFDSAAENTTASGSGNLQEAVISGNGSSVDTEGTSVDVAEGTENVTAGGESVSAGESVTTGSGSSSSDSGSSSSGGGGGSSSSRPSSYTVNYTLTYDEVTYTFSEKVKRGSTTDAPTAAELLNAEGTAFTLPSNMQITWYNGSEVFDFAAETIRSGKTLTGIVGSDSFAGGNGTQTYPYLISSAEELCNIDELSTKMKTNYYYFRQTEDIDLSSLRATGENNYLIQNFEGEYDGDNHKITGFSEDSGLLSVIYQNYMYLLGTQSAVFKDFTIELNGEKMTNWLAYGNLVIGREGPILFQNVDITQKEEGTNLAIGNNLSAYCIHVLGGEITFDSCDNYADFSVSGYAGIYVGGYVKDATAKFIDCTNYGDFTGANVAMFIGNPTLGKGATTVEVSGCRNEGLIAGTTTQGWFSKLSGSTSYQEYNTLLEEDYAGSQSMISGNDLGDDGAKEVTLDMAKNADGTIQITAGGKDAADVSYYWLRARRASNFQKQDANGDPVSGGSSYVSIDEKIEGVTVSATPFGNYSQYVDDVTYAQEVEFDDSQRENYVNARYVVIGDGTVVFNSADMMEDQAGVGEIFISGTVNGEPTLILEAYDATGRLLAELRVEYSDLQAAE